MKSYKMIPQIHLRAHLPNVDGKCDDSNPFIRCSFFGLLPVCRQTCSTKLWRRAQRTNRPKPSCMAFTLPKSPVVNSVKLMVFTLIELLVVIAIIAI
ncbi:MAG: prepilin-type N-terminal cleavage/methylation domain-containing protein, partial [Victivallales bacterium]|nr:prepilin-type N-terminal cleavage/methylation domain-containing protein [Victivallales bacterium]